MNDLVDVWQLVDFSGGVVWPCAVVVFAGRPVQSYV